MSRYVNTFESQTDGTDVTASNSDDHGDAGYTTGSVPTNSSIKYEADAAVRGSMGISVVTTAASISVYMQKTVAAADYYNRCIGVNWPSLPTGTPEISQMRTASGLSVGLRMNATGHYLLVNAAGSTISGSTLTTGVSAATDHYVEYRARPNASSTTGEWWIWLYDSSGTLLDSASGSGANLGSAQIAFVRTGRTAGTSWIGTIYYDDDISEDLATGNLGVPGVTAPTAVSATYEGFIVDMRSSTGNGGDLSYPDPTRISGPSLTFTEVEDGLFVFTPVDTGGDSVYAFGVSESPGSTDSTEVTIPMYVPGITVVAERKYWDVDEEAWIL